MRPPLTLSLAYRFFAPLIVMTALTMGSMSMIHATLARMGQPKVLLAAFAIAVPRFRYQVD